MFELAEIARMEELRQARGLADIADEARPIAGGIMGRGTPGAWTNYAVALGLGGPVSGAEIDEVVAFFRERSIEPRVELCPFADESLIAGLAERAFVVRLFEMVFFRELDRAARVEPLHAPDGLAIRAVDPSNEDEVREFARVTVAGFMADGAPVGGEFLDVCIRSARHPRHVPVAGFLDGRMVGAGMLEIAPPAAGLFGLSVLPEFRRRGVQQSLIAFRLNVGAERGCAAAFVSSKPGVATVRNVTRMGFRVAYTKAAMVLPGPGLAPVRW